MHWFIQLILFFFSSFFERLFATYIFLICIELVRMINEHYAITQIFLYNVTWLDAWTIMYLSEHRFAYLLSLRSIAS